MVLNLCVILGIRYLVIFIYVVFSFMEYDTDLSKFLIN